MMAWASRQKTTEKDGEGTATTGKGWRVLSIDGGGVKGIMPLIVLQELAKESGLQAKDCFDLIIGTSAGSICAVLLGLLGYTADQCVNIFEDLGRTVFGRKWWDPRIGVFRSLYVAKPLEDLLKAKIKQAGFAENIKLSELPPSPTRPHVVLVSLEERHFDQPFLFCNFQVAGDYARFSATEIPVWQALRASSAAPHYFPKMTINIDGRSRSFVDGGLGCNNPSEESLRLLKTPPFCHRDGLAYLVSLGTGREIRPVMPMPHPLDWLGLLEDVTTNSEAVHRRMPLNLRIFFPSSQGCTTPYYRFNTDIVSELNQLDDWRDVSKLVKEMQSYLLEPITTLLLKELTGLMLTQQAQQSPLASVTAEMKVSKPRQLFITVENCTKSMLMTACNGNPGKGRCLDFQQRLLPQQVDTITYTADAAGRIEGLVRYALHGPAVKGEDSMLVAFRLSGAQQSSSSWAACTVSDLKQEAEGEEQLVEKVFATYEALAEKKVEVPGALCARLKMDEAGAETEGVYQLRVSLCQKGCM